MNYSSLAPWVDQSMVHKGLLWIYADWCSGLSFDKEAPGNGRQNTSGLTKLEILQL